MTDAQLMEEELQQSVMVSEEDAEFEDDLPDNSPARVNDEAYRANNQTNAGALDEGDEAMPNIKEDESDDGEEDGAAFANAENGDSADESPDEDAGGDDDEDAFEDDAEGEDDDEPISRPLGIPVAARANNKDRGENNEEEEEEDEGVGAVKIRPGETDDEEESEDSAVSPSGRSSDEESEEDEEWEDAAANEAEDEEDGSEAENANICIFCKQNEENDPGEEFEPYLTCSSCGENSHQQCAREADALSSQQTADNWKCPNCAIVEPEEEDADIDDVAVDAIGDNDGDDGDDDGDDDDDDMPQTTRRSSAPKLARDLLPPQRGPGKPDSHSVFNHLVLDEDPMDGSRILRKRKTSSVEADESIMSLRKRRRNTADDQIVETANATDDSTRPHSSRSLRLKLPQQPAATILKKTRKSLVLKIQVNSSSLRQIVSRKPRGHRKQSSRGGARSSRPNTARSAGTEVSSHTAPFIAPSFSQPFYSFYDKETDELKGKPYGGILNEAEADTSKTLPTNDDRRRFDEAKQQAEEEWRQRLLAMQAEIQAPSKKSKKSAGPASQIECIEFGGWEIDTWYAAPYPEEYSRNRVLYICEFCLKYMNSDYVAWRHKLKCPAKQPPGDEIYRHESVSVFEVDGRKNPVYCQNLCLLAKLFLGSKTLYYDVEPFLFYVLCEYDDLGYHFVGYFSKEKRASSQNNVSCILTLPIHQRKGYGNLLIDFSYLLTRVEQKTGSPEKPLSDMGLVSYRNYWRLILCRYLLDRFPEDKTEKWGLSIKQISDDTGFTADDVISALEGLRCLVRDPQTKQYAFRVDLDYCRQYVTKWESKNYVQLKPKALTWTPYVMGRSNATNFELGPALNAIAPREEEEVPKPAVVAEAEAEAEVIINGENGTGRAVVNGVRYEEGSDVAPAVMESTEPDETGANTNGHPSEDGRTNGVVVNGVGSVVGSKHGSAVAGTDHDEDWTAPYANIPTSRFEVFPPITGTRRVDRVRSTVGRPPASRTASSASRPKPRRSTGVRRSTSSMPKSSVKRKSGGTGRGPGRWPKGTKKSDYGNADSGPGLPPAWIAERNRLSDMAAERTKPKKEEEDGKETEDTVEVQTPTTKGGAGKNSKGRPSPKSSKANSNVGEDVQMANADGDGGRG